MRIKVLISCFLLLSSSFTFQKGNLTATAVFSQKNCSIDTTVSDNSEKPPCVDLIIFSYNRPMQLYALSESIKKYLTGIHSITVLYRSTSEKFDQGYAIVQRDFPTLHFIHQGNQPYQDFKPLLMNIFNKGESSYCMFAVDDILVLEPVDLTHCVQCMEHDTAHGFYLRLGKNIIRNYTIQQPCCVPSGVDKVYAGVTMFSWRFADGKGDWMISHSVDMTIFRKKDIAEWVRNLSYYSPNTFEAALINQPDVQKKGLCFATSKIVNVPLNIVQENTTHRHMNLISAQELLEEFLAGYKIDIRSFEGMVPDAPHMEWIPHLIKRHSE